MNRTVALVVSALVAVGLPGLSSCGTNRPSSSNCGPALTVRVGSRTYGLTGCSMSIEPNRTSIDAVVGTPVAFEPWAGIPYSVSSTNQTVLVATGHNAFATTERGRADIVWKGALCPKGCTVVTLIVR